MKTYKKTHESESVLKNHIEKIEKRGGDAKRIGMTVYYTFPEKEKARYSSSTGVWNEKEEAIKSFIKMVQKYGKSPYTLNPEQSKEVVKKFAQRYTYYDYNFAESTIAGFAYDPFMIKKYRFSFDRNFGLYNISLEKK